MYFEEKKGKESEESREKKKKNRTLENPSLLAGYSNANRAWHIYFRSGFCPEAPRWRTFRVNFNSWFLLDPPYLTYLDPLPPSPLFYITSRQMEESATLWLSFHLEEVVRCVRRTQLSAAACSRNDLNGCFAQLPIALSIFSLLFSLEKRKREREREEKNKRKSMNKSIMRDRVESFFSNDREELLNLTCLLESSEWN